MATSPVEFAHGGALWFESDDLGISTDSEQQPWKPGLGSRTGEQTSSRASAGPAAAVGSDGEADGEADVREYGKTLGIDADRDADLLWVVHEAFVASLPPSWTEYCDEDGRVYFYNQATRESSWSHPMDGVYREIIQLVKAVRAEPGGASDARRAEAVQAHLEAVRGRAMEQLEGWSGPYTSENGAYYHNAALDVSLWDSPVDEWQSELELRQQVLHRCLLAGGTAPGRGLEGAAAGLTEETLGRLPLGLHARSPGENAPLPQSPGSARSARSFLSARSTCTARSMT
eukprot:CAMPEP_0168448626 /NCGR_PEP_ID=MMETSP0228-20121227/47188_1 /TAXON_ID=133427 /ORGANISM="Protoceratium reticulatum, Strain CCCM 535 (=CCMP 1889)" /LENGTH=286 /DNA_ID=CAMNT_0008463159 /DNA_START=42 /DNA_END=899 /DNA_ORIENTATION=-